jgi:hypothetical protein
VRTFHLLSYASISPHHIPCSPSSISVKHLISSLPVYRCQGSPSMHPPVDHGGIAIFSRHSTGIRGRLNRLEQMKQYRAGLSTPEIMHTRPHHPCPGCPIYPKTRCIRGLLWLRNALGGRTSCFLITLQSWCLNGLGDEEDLALVQTQLCTGICPLKRVKWGGSPPEGVGRSRKMS